MSTVELSSIVEAAFPQLKDRIKSIEGRVRKVASWAKSEGLVGLHKGTIEILPLFECPSDARKRERVIEEAHPREEGYLPTKVDLERAIDSLHTLTSDNEIDFDDLLVALEEDLFARGKTLKKNWRLETERNLDRWYS